MLTRFVLAHFKKISDKFDLVVRGERLLGEIRQEAIVPAQCKETRRKQEATLGPRQVGDQGRTDLRRYFETGSALFVFIWSRKTWKSNGTSAGVAGAPGAGGGATGCAVVESWLIGGSMKATAVADEGTGCVWAGVSLASSSEAGDAFSIESISRVVQTGSNKRKRMIHELVKQG